MLVGSYFLHRWAQKDKERVATLLWQGLQRDSLMFVYGDEDPWQPDELPRRLVNKFRKDVFERCGHVQSKQLAIDAFWSRLVW